MDASKKDYSFYVKKKANMIKENSIKNKIEDRMNSSSRVSWLLFSREFKIFSGNDRTLNTLALCSKELCSIIDFLM